jgi:hypothetical protein
MDLKSESARELSKREVFLELRKYIQEQIDLSNRKMMEEENFSLPSWSEYQAYQLGFQKAFLKLYNQLPDQGELNE